MNQNKLIEILINKIDEEEFQENHYQETEPIDYESAYQENADYYNKTEDKREALSSLSNIYTGLVNREKDLLKEISKELHNAILELPKFDISSSFLSKYFSAKSNYKSISNYLRKYLENYYKYQSILPNLISIGYIIDMICMHNFPVNIDTAKSNLQNEKHFKELDKIPNHHIHRKKEIIKKYKEIENNHTECNQQQIIKGVQNWYMDLTGKDINEGTIRYYIGEK